MEQEHQGLFSTIHVVVCNEKCIFWSRDIEEAKAFAFAHIKEIRSFIDEEEYQLEFLKEEFEWSLVLKKRGYLWDGDRFLHTKVSVQTIDSICERV